MTKTSLEAWQARIAKEVGDADLETLRRTTPTGLTVEPLYADAAKGTVVPEPQTVPAAVVCEYDDWDWARLCASVGEDLAGVERGEAWIRFDRSTRIGVTHGIEDSVHVGVGGTVVATASELGALFDVCEPGTKVVLDPGANTLPVHVLVEAAREGRHSSADVVVAFDPLASWAADGFLPASLNDLFEEVSGIDPRVCVSTLPYHAGGCDLVDELAFAIATAADYLRELGDRNVSLSQPVDFRVAVTPDIFPEMAKLRALRVLYAKLAGAFDLDIAARIDAVVSMRTMSTREPWINGLRGTAAALAAQSGGADGICVRPYDALQGAASPLGRRIARNVDIILSEEAHVGRVVDPGRGSGYIEALTDELARAAWERFREIESEGGMISALASGWVKERVDASWQASIDRYAAGGVLVGVNEYGSGAEALIASPSDKDVDAIHDRFGELRELELEGVHEARAAAREGATIDDLSMGLVRGQVPGIEPLVRRRLAAELGWEAGQ